MRWAHRCFDAERRFRDPALDHIAVHGLADELGEAGRKYRAAEPDAMAEVAEVQGRSGFSWINLSAGPICGSDMAPSQPPCPD